MKHPIPFILGLLIACLFGHSASLSGQNVLTDMDHDAHQIYDRMIILSGGGDPLLHSSIKPFWRKDLVSLADSFSYQATDPVDIHNIRFIWDQNNEFIKHGMNSAGGSPYNDSINALILPSERIPFSRYRLSKHPLWNTFYRTPAHFYAVDVKDFYLRVNPVIHLAAGRESEEGVTTFINQRGLSIRGGVGKNVFFQTSLLDNQVRYPNYINQYTDTFGVVPGAGLFKDFKSNFFDFTRGRDFLLAQAYVGINLGKYFGFQLGHNQHFIGDGIRSLLLSDFSTPYFSLKINTRIWKFQYQNIFAELAADNFVSASGPSALVPKKYMAAHYLSFKPIKNITLGLFETVVFNRAGNQFELQYLNPIILYRTIEGSIGSPDNVLLGFNARVDVLRTFSFYGQFVLDDILIGNIIDGKLDWWGNKFGHQLGAKYINVFGIHFLDAQLEWNQVRPYTYSHYDENANYSNYKQPLAHPLGANFNEWIASIRFQASPRLHFQSSLYIISTGEDMDSISYGGNVIAPNTRRPGDFGHTIGQGIKTDITYWSSSVRFELTPGVFLDGQYVYRNKTSELPDRSLKTNLFQFGVRYNIARREEVF
jgi:Capsule assembly protein Wzi